MRDDDGGAAFPSSNDEAVQYNWINYGMSLRDWFAGQALSNYASDYPAKEAARLAYADADAMLAERMREADTHV